MPESDLPERADRLDDPSALDDALIPAMAVLSAVPIVGSFVATYISEYVPRQKQ